MPEGAVRDFIFSFLIDDGVIHVQRCENARVEKISIRLPRRFSDDEAENDVAGIAIRPARSRCEFSFCFFFQKAEHFVILDLMFWRPERTFYFFFSFHQVFVVGQTAGVIEKIPNGNIFTVGGKIREHFRESLVIAELSIMDEQHDSHGAKLFGERGEAKIGVLVDFRVCPQIADTVSFFKRCACIFAYEYGQSGSFFLGYGTKNCVGLFLQGRGWGLRAELDCAAKKYDGKKNVR